MYYFPGPQTRRCQILEKEVGMYTTLVVYDVDNDKYLMITIFPNWTGYIPEVGDFGYLEFEFVKGGVDQYYNKAENKQYLYSNTYMFFKKFIADSKTTEVNEIVFK